MLITMIIEPRRKKTCFCHIRTTKVQISPARMISTFVVHFLDSIIPLLAISEISSLQLVSVAGQAGLNLTWSKIPKTGFLVMWLILASLVEGLLIGKCPSSLQGLNILVFFFFSSHLTLLLYCIITFKFLNSLFVSYVYIILLKI